MKSFLTFAFLLLIGSVSFSQVSDGSASLTNTISISLDEVAFDETSYISIKDSENNTIAYYDRFENKSSRVKSVKLFNQKKEWVYTLVPVITDTGYKIHLMNQNQSKGYIDLTEKQKGLKVIYQADVSFFQEPYAFEYTAKIGVGKVSMRKAVNYQGREIMAWEEKASAFNGVESSPVLIDKSFYSDNQLEAASWVLIMHLLDELTTEDMKSQRNRQIVGFNR